MSWIQTKLLKTKMSAFPPGAGGDELIKVHPEGKEGREDCVVPTGPWESKDVDLGVFFPMQNKKGNVGTKAKGNNLFHTLK